MKRHYAWFLHGLVLAVLVGAAVLAHLLSAPAPTGIQATTARALDEAYGPLEPTGMFGPGDVFYLSVRVERAPEGSTIGVRWRYADTLITDEEQALGPTAEVYVLGFELRRVDQPWPVGTYSAEVLLNGEPVGVAEFAVVAPAAP
ncbi:MAG: hypothetical protein JW910_23830 [Anaerolineae bacterium]|nr:hypothetical protein [Anaerolineae bacterium]